MLERLAAEGLIAATASEREGSYPERTVYELTPAGRHALTVLLDLALRKVVLPPDPFDLALASGDLADPDQLRGALVQRRDERTALRHPAGFADQYLSVAERKVLAYRAVRLDTEIRWHDDVLAALPDIVADFVRRRSLPQEDQ